MRLTSAPCSEQIASFQTKESQRIAQGSGHTRSARRFISASSPGCSPGMAGRPWGPVLGSLVVTLPFSTDLQADICVSPKQRVWKQHTC